MQRRTKSLSGSSVAADSEPNRWIARACVGGLLAVLCFLAGFSLVTENDLAARATDAQRSSHLAELYGDARFWVGQEESLERKYRLEPSPAVLAVHTSAATNLTRDLSAIGRIDRSSVTARLVARLAYEQRRYATATVKMFDAVDRHNTPLVSYYDHQVVDPIFGAIQTAVYAHSAISATGALQARGVCAIAPPPRGPRSRSRSRPGCCCSAGSHRSCWGYGAGSERAPRRARAAGQCRPDRLAHRIAQPPRLSRGPGP